MKYKFYSTSKETWDAMLADIRGAQKSVYLEMYIFLSDTFPTHNFYEALADRARAGISVKIIADAFGSSTVKNADIDRLRQAGAEVLFFRGILQRTHRKILVIDERVGFIGGVNIGNQYSNWLDLHMRFEGRIVKSLVGLFAHSYKKVGGADPRVVSKTVGSRLKRARLWLFDHIPTPGRNPLGRYYRTQFKDAKESITIVSPYFIPAPWLIRELERALLRGVRVEIILPEHTDPQAADLAHRVFVRALFPKGAHFFFTRMMLHAKAVIIDNREAIVGSHNIDGLSFDFNLEAGILFQRKDMLRSLAAIINRWKKDAFEFNPKSDTPRWYDIFVEFAVWLLQPIV